MVVSEGKNVAKYFSHDSNARNDTKILSLRMQHGLEGYAVYFMLLERLREAPEYWSKTDYNAIGFDFRCSAGLVRSVVEDFGLFTVVDDRFFSSSFTRRMGLVDAKKEQVSSARKKAASARWRKAQQASEESTENANAMQMHAKKMQNDAKQNKTKPNKTKPNKTEQNKTITKQVTTNRATHASRQKSVVEQARPHSQATSDEKDGFATAVVCIIAHLNEQAQTRYRATTPKTRQLIKARLKEGFSLADFHTVIDKKCAEWRGTEWERYLRPETLFGVKFEGYLNAQVVKSTNHNVDEFNRALAKAREIDARNEVYGGNEEPFTAGPCLPTRREDWDV